MIATVTVERTVCPAELRTAPPLKPVQPEGGAITADAATLDWLGLVARWGEDLFARLTDAAKQCPQP